MTQRLKELGIFEDVDALIDEGSTPNLSRVKVTVKERSAVTGQIGGFMGSDEGTFVRRGPV